ncbi:hypothetical protein M440DRAFT_1420184 [Trichoderma longibrachiatum ATCC 18648]|uniref:DUF6546 domain-containing protein n=1 Tax=Trichoderma longibrachiatum ATCC 18648 TaxID=983965 RepID=A0A2T4C8Y5_TRILO|nr:hypothetical protein M440DRAFT_1420184 [Trichoderma longibrachiatum ATCC 18648]
MSSAPSTDTSWNCLPPETRQQILQALLEQHDCRLAPYATVSREWQAVIEPHSFSRIRLTPSRIEDFQSMVHRNRAYVRYIWLCVELAEYNCFMCAPMDPILRGFCTTDSFRLMTALLDVFTVLSRWESRDSLQLDISIYSVSDSEHWFKYLTFDPDDPFKKGDRRRRIERAIRDKCDDWNHGWRGGRRSSAPDSWAMHKIFNEIMGDGPFSEDEHAHDYWQLLPLVPAVTSVLLRQQNRRRWKPTALACILGRLPRLREVHYEPWRPWVHAQQVSTDEGMQSLLQALASRQVRRLILFETSCPQYLLDFPNFNADRGSTVGISRAMARASLMLEHLSASFMVEASQFFAARDPYWRWRNLTWLALTSRLLTPVEDPDTRDDMLRAAAAAATAMRKLETMEIWNGSEGLAMVFRYKRAPSRGTAEILIRGTWELTLHPAVVHAWEAVARRHCCYGCAIERESLDAAAITSYGDAVHYLRLSNPVIRPISLEQIRMEQRIRDGTFSVSSREEEVNGELDSE